MTLTKNTVTIDINTNQKDIYKYTVHVQLCSERNICGMDLSEKIDYLHILSRFSYQCSVYRKLISSQFGGIVCLSLAFSIIIF